MTLTAILTIVYMVAVLAVGYISTKGKGGAREFFVAGGNLPWILLTPFLMAEYISSGTTVGVAEKVHQSGITALMYYLAAPLGLCLLAFGFAKFYKQIKKITLGEVFGTLFDQKTRQAFVVVMLVFHTIGAGTAAVALGTILGPMFGISYESGIWLAAAFLVVMALLGLRGQAWMNVIHLAAIMVCFIPVAIAAVGGAGGLANIAKAVPSGHLNLMSAGLPTILAWITSSTLIKLISLIAIVAMFAARNDRDAKVAAVSTGFLVLAFTFLPALIGLAGYVLTPGIESRHALWEVSEHLGEWAAIFTAIGVLAAVVSTTPISMMALGSLFARDVVLPLKPNLSDRAQVIACRCAVVVIGFVGTYLAIIAIGQAGGILAFGFKSVQTRTVMVIPLMISIMWRRLNPTVVFWSIVLGVSTGIIWLFAGSPFGVEVLWPSLGVALFVLIIGSLIAKPVHLKGAEGLVPATNPDSSH